MTVESHSGQTACPMRSGHAKCLSRIRTRRRKWNISLRAYWQTKQASPLRSDCSLKLLETQTAAPPLQHDTLPTVATQQPNCLARREVLHMTAAAALVLGHTTEAKASALPQAVDNAWTSLGGGPSDLTFPDSFLGTWRVQATLTKVETPLGPEFVPDMKHDPVCLSPFRDHQRKLKHSQVIDRARQEDLQHPQKYLVTFMRNSRGQVVLDRRFNTAQLMGMYLNRPLSEDIITWNPDNPNQLRMNIPGSIAVTTRVTRRLQETPADDKLSTSEYFQQTFETPGRPNAKVKASQCYTKYKFRSQEAADRMAGPAVVATQVISDYLTAYDGELLLLKSQNRPVAVYTYSLVFVRPRGLAV